MSVTDSVVAGVLIQTESTPATIMRVTVAAFGILIALLAVATTLYVEMIAFDAALANLGGSHGFLTTA